MFNLIFEEKVDGSGNSYRKVSVKKVAAFVAAAVLVLMIPLCCIRTVSTGYTGILTTFGKVENVSLDAGVHLKLPWQKIVTIDNRVQKVNLDTEAFSSDIQQTVVQLAVNYSIDQQTAQDLYKKVGKNYYENIVYPRILEDTKAIFAQYSAENLIAKRNELANRIEQLLSEDMKPYGVNIVSLSIQDIDFTDEFTDAVERKQVAVQEKLTAETKQAQATMEQQAEAERAVIKAKADAEQAKIAAEADLEVVKIQSEAALFAGEKEAEANRKIGDTLNQQLIKYYYIKQWNGELPDTMLSDASEYLISVN